MDKVVRESIVDKMMVGWYSFMFSFFFLSFFGKRVGIQFCLWDEKVFRVPRKGIVDQTFDSRGCFPILSRVVCQIDLISWVRKRSVWCIMIVNPWEPFLLKIDGLLDTQVFIPLMLVD